MLGPPLIGAKVTLATPTLEAMLLFPRWIAHPEVRRFMRVQHPPSAAVEHDYYEQGARDPEVVLWSLVVPTEQGATIIGSTGLHRIDWRNRQATSGIIIGEPAFWGQGIASEAMALRTRYAFHDLGLEKIMTEIAVENVGSRRAAEKAGYREVGIRRRHMWREGRWHDMWLAEVLRDDWLVQQGALTPSTE